MILLDTKGMANLRNERDLSVLITGNIAPNFVLSTVDGRSVSLSETLCSGRGVLLVFLRHLG